MKRPEKIIKWFMVERKKEQLFVDHNGKPLFKYSIELPYWLAKAYKPFWVKVEIRANPLSYADMQREENKEETEAYLKANWRKKIAKFYKRNNGFLLVATTGKGSGFFKSMEDYENYHKELAVLNAKYCCSLSESSTTKSSEKP